MVDLTHLHTNIRHLATCSDHERLCYLTEPIWIGYDLGNRTLKRLKQMMDHPSTTKSLLISGSSDSGKTALCEHFFKLNGEGYVDDQDRPHRPVIMIQAPPGPDRKDLYASILDQFHAPYRISEHHGVLRSRCVDMMRKCNVQLFMIDEFHSLLAGSAMDQSKIMTAIKYLCNSLKIPIVAFGTEDAVNVITQDRQYIKRFKIHKIGVWDDKTEFQKFLARFENIIPLQKPSFLSEKKMAAKIYAATNRGLIGPVKDLLTACAEEAIKDKTETITIATINKCIPTLGRSDGKVLYIDL